MKQSDYILREIERISELIMGILGKLHKKRKEDQVWTEDTLEEELSELSLDDSIDLQSLLYIDSSDFEKELIKSKGFNTANIDLLADTLVAVGDLCEANLKIKHYLKALELYQFIIDTEKVFSMERMEKISLIKDKIEE